MINRQEVISTAEENRFSMGLDAPSLKLVGHGQFKRVNPKSDLFKVRRNLSNIIKCRAFGILFCVVGPFLFAGMWLASLLFAALLSMSDNSVHAVTVFGCIRSLSSITSTGGVPMLPARRGGEPEG